MIEHSKVAFHYRVMKLIEENPQISQRELASHLGLSLGKVNYCLKAFIAKGWVKVNNFRRSDNKPAYAYLLTPGGIEEKTRVTMQFFQRVEGEYEMLKREIESYGINDSVTESGSHDVERQHANEGDGIDWQFYSNYLGRRHKEI